MARESFAHFITSSSKRALEALAVLASAKNPDGTDFALPVEIVSGGGSGGVTQVEGKDAIGEDLTSRPVVQGGIVPNNGIQVTAIALEEGGAQRVSLYGKFEDAGDIPVKVSENGFLRLADAKDTSLNFQAAGLHGDGNAFDDTGVVSGLSVASVSYLFNGSTFDRQRTPNMFRPFNFNEGGGVIWACPTGKRIRLMGYVLVYGTQSVGGDQYEIGSDTTHVIEFISNDAPRAVSPNLGNGLLLNMNENLHIMPGGDGFSIFGYVFGTEE